MTDDGKARADPRMEKALAHPLRAKALPLFGERPMSPSEVARRLGVDIASLAYHVRMLRRLGCIELVETKQRRGAVEHFYRAAGPRSGD